VPDAGAPEDVPIRGGDGVLVADRQRHEDAAQPSLAEVLEHRRADLAAPAVQRIGPAVDPRGESFRRPRGADVAGGAQVPLQRPRLEVVGMRIGERARPLQARREAPALAGDDLRRTSRIACPAIAIPGERDERGKRHVRANRVLDLEGEARAALRELRQAGDDAGDLDIRVFQRTGQRFREAHLGAPRRISEARRRATEGEQQHARNAPLARHQRQRERRRERGERPVELG
jgi:hypothetical protein